ncbi:MAG: glycosyltransferase [bacterium]|nr:glycosyltransferase [bacterium]
MKILHVIDSFGLYGAERVVLTLMEEHRRSGHQPILGSIGSPGAAMPAIEAEASRRGLRVEGFRMLDGPNLSGALRIAHFARAEGVDLIHSHGYKGNILLGFLPRRWRGAPMISTLHGWLGVRRWSWLRLFEALDGLSLRRLDAVVGVDPGMFSHPRLRRVSCRRLLAIPNGVTPAPREALPGDPAIARLLSSGPTLVSLGRLSPEKGYSVLLEALRRSIDRDADLRLVVFGEGPERGRLDAEIETLGLSERVLLAGFAREVRSYLSRFDGFVLASVTEGWPISVLEAMQSGLPVVATAVGGVPEQLADGEVGILVAPGDPSRLAEALCRLYHDPALRGRLAEQAKARVERNYTSRRMASAYEALYRSLGRRKLS